MAIPYVRAIDVEYGRCDQVSPLIRRVIANNPGPFTFTGTGTYIVGRGEVAVIDPGPDDEAHLAALLAALGQERVTHILITHHHLDHSPLAAALQARTGAPIYGCEAPAETAAVAAEAGLRLDAAHDGAFHPDVSLCDGGVVSGPGWTLEAIPTPGHTSNHLCYALAEENALFTGDHVMGWSTTVIAPPDGDMTDYMESLERIRGRDFTTLWPTHGPPIREVGAFLKAYATHRRARETQILTALAEAPGRIRELVPRLYADTDPRLHPAAARSMLAHMIDLARRGVIHADPAPEPDAEYRLA
jgi:glyoxylase-like metal-dependent hydrolase (beta-lactamase superfamily II)